MGSTGLEHASVQVIYRNQQTCWSASAATTFLASISFFSTEQLSNLWNFLIGIFFLLVYNLRHIYKDMCISECCKFERFKEVGNVAWWVTWHISCFSDWSAACNSLHIYFNVTFPYLSNNYAINNFIKYTNLFNHLIIISFTIYM